MKEIWKEIGDYQISNYGNCIGKMNKLLSKRMAGGYIRYNINGDEIFAHHLVWDNFGSGKRNGRKLQVDHIDENKLNNRIDNLQLLSNRENSSKGRFKYKKSSQYTGVYKLKNGWCAEIQINGKRNYLGYFQNEYDAHLAYKKELEKI